MKNSLIIFLCITCISCTKNKNETETTSQEPQTTSYECKDLDSGVVNFRKQCSMGLELYTNYRSGSSNKLAKWCDCYEKNFMWEQLLNEACEIPNLAIMRERVNSTKIQAKCRTPDTLL